MSGCQDCTDDPDSASVLAADRDPEPNEAEPDNAEPDEFVAGFEPL
jgi:hypothetical protein